MLVALLATAAWALSCVIDVCFVGSGIFRKASDGPAIAGLFCCVPLILTVGQVDLDGSHVSTLCVGVLSGAVFLLHLFCYFRALFALNDAVNAEIFNTLCVLIVPLLAFLFLDERLSPLHYLAIALAALGVLVLVACQTRRLSLRAVFYLLAAVIAVSIMMVMQAWVLESASYATSICLFSGGAFITALLLFGLPTARRRHLRTLCSRFGGLFVAVQFLELGAVLGSQRATDLSPSVSLVALLECSLPVFVMLFSWVFAAFARQRTKAGSVALRLALSKQTTAAPSKVASMLMIIVAITLAGE